MKGVGENSQNNSCADKNARGDNKSPKKIWGYCSDCGKYLLREHSKRCTTCSQGAYKRKWARRRNGKL